MNETEINENLLLQPVNMLNLYAQGAFPMAEANGEINWYQPKERAVILMEEYNIPRSLKKFMKTTDFTYNFDINTEAVISGCANRKETWISDKLIDAYKRLIDLGYLHSVEVYQKNKLVGGLYGISIGGAFFGESMFSKVSQASKTALAVLLKYLEKRCFTILDVQFETDHLNMFGVKIVEFEEYKKLLDKAFINNISFI
ncbi:MAG: leucyl/phenylalanyl-tRNA--protein transferase [Ignavibacteriae bacterium]|nr:MAG: leucyl/phenylalanyl-tRNA--protein transferase [Ignavibacteriota bacterium]